MQNESDRRRPRVAASLAVRTLQPLLAAMSLLLAPAIAACSARAGASAGDASSPDGGSSDLSTEHSYLTQLASADDLAVLGAPGIAGVKYLASRAGAQPLPPLTEPCYFQNMKRYSWHLQFLQSFSELADLPYDVYTRLVLIGSSRRLWGGAVTAWPAVGHPVSHAVGVISYSVYGDPGSVGFADLVEVDRTLKDCMPFARSLLVFVPETVDQRALMERDRSSLLSEGVASLFPEDLTDGRGPIVYSPGEGYGTLRVVPPGQTLSDYGPHDVVVVESAPNSSPISH